MTHSLIDRMFAVPDQIPADAASPSQLAACERALAWELDPLLKDVLLRSNGGELCIARMPDPYLPDEEALVDQDLWQELWEPYAHQVASWKFEPQGLLLPLGDDYSGEIIMVDGRADSRGQILHSNDAREPSSPDDFEVLAENFADYIERTIDEFTELDSQDGVAKSWTMAAAGPRWADEINRRQHALADLNLNCEHLELQTPVGEQLWSALKFERQQTMLGANHFAWPLATPRYFGLRTQDGPSLIVWDGQSLQVETFLNDIQANERRAEFGPVGEDPLGFERGRITKSSEQLVLFESAFFQDYQDTHTPAEWAGRVLFGVIANHGDGIHWLRFELRQLGSREQANTWINRLLKPGYDWLATK